MLSFIYVGGTRYSLYCLLRVSFCLYLIWGSFPLSFRQIKIEIYLFQMTIGCAFIFLNVHFFLRRNEWSHFDCWQQYAQLNCIWESLLSHFDQSFDWIWLESTESMVMTLSKLFIVSLLRKTYDRKVDWSIDGRKRRASSSN